MSLMKIAGKVSHLDRISTTGVSGSNGAVAISTSHQTTFRVNGCQVSVRGPMTWVANDDHIAMVGVDDFGFLDPLAVRNDTSGYESYAETRTYTLAIVLLFLGFFTFFITTAIGVWLIWGIKKRKKLKGI